MLQGLPAHRPLHLEATATDTPGLRHELTHTPELSTDPHFQGYLTFEPECRENKKTWRLYLWQAGRWSVLGWPRQALPEDRDLYVLVSLEQKGESLLLHHHQAFRNKSHTSNGQNNNNNNNRRLVTLAEHTSDHGRQTNSSTEEKGEQV